MKMDLRSLENEISQTKRELNQLFREESLASRRGDATEARKQHVALLEKELENIATIASYLEAISPPVARDLTRWRAQTSSRFNDLKRSGNAVALQTWVTQELVPLLRRSEQAAHLVATTVRVGPRKASTPFAWPI
jgi:predicted RNase H-like nuclease (RuvC/YqgF family)